MENVREILKVNLLKARLEQGLTQEDLAHLAQMDVSYLSRIERGKVNPGIEAIAQLAAALRTTTSKLLLDDEEQPQR